MSHLKPFPASEFSFNLFGAGGVAWYFLAVTMLLFSTKAAAQDALLNASYDVSRELYREINASFAADWKPGRDAASKFASLMPDPAFRLAP